MFHFSIWYCALHSRARCVSVHMWWFCKDFVLCVFGWLFQVQMLTNCKGFTFLTAQSLSAPVWGFTFLAFCGSTPSDHCFLTSALGRREGRGCLGQGLVLGRVLRWQSVQEKEWLPVEEGRRQERWQGPPVQSKDLAVSRSGTQSRGSGNLRPPAGNVGFHAHERKHIGLHGRAVGGRSH